METGTLSEWYLEEGSGFSAGESIAKIETDKASIDFEAQDDGYIGKLKLKTPTRQLSLSFTKRKIAYNILLNSLMKNCLKYFD